MQDTKDKFVRKTEESSSLFTTTISAEEENSDDDSMPIQMLHKQSKATKQNALKKKKIWRGKNNNLLISFSIFIEYFLEIRFFFPCI